VTAVFVARRPFGPEAGERWNRYLAWSRLTHLRELVSLDTILCPEVPESLVPADWEHNVHEDYQTTHFRSFSYLRKRVAGTGPVNLLAIVRNPPSDPVSLPQGFSFEGFDVVDVHGDVSALTNCGGFDDVFSGSELSRVGLLSELRRAKEVRRDLRSRYPQEGHAVCDVWAVWRWTTREASSGHSPSDGPS
jgi:hypothetical protein